MRLKKIKLPIHQKEFKPTSSTYLAKIDGRWYTGEFWAQQYGWNFDARLNGYQISYSFDDWSSPSVWKELYEILDGKRSKPRSWKKESGRKGD
jgi:hypothetical protein